MSSGVVLGAMLPDFATMCRGGIAATADVDVTRGIALHHATDSAFHQLPVVVGLMRELDARLAHGGCARGPRRAVAHIGVELLLDGILVDDATYRAAYLTGLGHDETTTRWRGPDEVDRFNLLVQRLRGYGVPDDLKRADAIAQRLARILAHRPLLAPSTADLVAIRVALADHQARVEVATDTVMRALRVA